MFDDLSLEVQVRGSGAAVLRRINAMDEALVPYGVTLTLVV